MIADPEIEAALWDDWHVVGEVEQLMQSGRLATGLLGVPLVIELEGAAPRVLAESGGPIRSQVRYGYVWACLGTPCRDIVDFPECADPERLVVTAGSLGVAVSGLRAVENFLDLGHLGF
ncbi:MAG TPA: aromatic ring-hydroxylating dioxygenase subunit alpha, partial [Alphaproteobacteria bacterium]|nr:aromatic ring-hydroxylating dioxygenase subunit alpha [Alphaproteobacteria bacterium]